ncbi:MAG TPA: Crp/Fnr family transcriptional regulator [Virgibacillus sp.]|nr:Crp/Fnr family transcriptional regulator [Virgibacillus sp.]HLR69719.1 Crp/Fnr family transcriptional regulator [Virgibacillus sp.]
MNDVSLSDELKDLLSTADNTYLLKKGDRLFTAGEKAENIFIVRSGKIQIGKMTADGRELVLRLSKTGDIVGEIALYTGSVKYILTATALIDSEVVAINKEDLEQKLLENSKLAIEFINIITEMSLRDQTKLRDLVMYGRKGALYSTLIRLANSYGVVKNDEVFINIKLTVQELANFCGTSRESVSRLLSDLRKSHIVTTKKGYITIHDIEQLKKEINCEHCPIIMCSIH